MLKIALLRKLLEKNNELYFKRLVGKAILFKYIENNYMDETLSLNNAAAAIDYYYAVILMLQFVFLYIYFII